MIGWAPLGRLAKTSAARSRQPFIPASSAPREDERVSGVAGTTLRVQMASFRRNQENILLSPSRTNMDVQVNSFASFAIFPPSFFTPPFGFLTEMLPV